MKSIFKYWFTIDENDPMQTTTRAEQVIIIGMMWALIIWVAFFVYHLLKHTT